VVIVKLYIALNFSRPTISKSGHPRHRDWIRL